MGAFIGCLIIALVVEHYLSEILEELKKGKK